MQISSASVFEVFGVYFANCYWNNLYEISFNVWHQESFESLDDAYKIVIKRYTTAFCQKTDANEKANKNYIDIIQDLYKSFIAYLDSPGTFYDFINTSVKFFIPADIYKNLNTRDIKKDNIFKEILSKTLQRFMLFIIQEELKNVLDPTIRKNAIAHVNRWKAKYIDILTQERNSFCNLLLARSTGIDITDAEEMPSIPKQIYDKLNEKIKVLVNEKSRLIKERNQYAQLAAKYKEMLQNGHVATSPKRPIPTIKISTPMPNPPQNIQVSPIESEESENDEQINEQGDFIADE